MKIDQMIRMQQQRKPTRPNQRPKHLKDYSMRYKDAKSPQMIKGSTRVMERTAFS
jgi:hypothetical protein